MLRELDLNQRSHQDDSTLSTNLMPICPHQDKKSCSPLVSLKRWFLLCVLVHHKAWLQRVDSNHRPSAYEADELPTATTLRY